MEINKQLFEDVLAGKLKGAFVLKNKQIVKSNTLKRSSDDNFPYKILVKYDNGIIDYGMYKSNGDFETFNTSYFDIIDFIPDIDKIEIDPEMYFYNEKDIQFIEHFINSYRMKENELTIEIPDNKVVDWDESKKQNKIVLKDKQLTYEDICKKLFQPNGYYYISGNAGIIKNPYRIDRFLSDANNAASKHQLECILAKNKLANVAKYLNDGWKHDCYNRDFGYFLCKLPKEIEIIQRDNYKFNNNIIFKSKELAQQAIEILGEETIKLALEPLGV